MDSLIQNELAFKKDMSKFAQPFPTLHPAQNNEHQNKKISFFLMTLEDNLGKCQQIKIYKNSNPSELAYNFCKENNLDFSSMKYIKANIKSIVRQFNEPKKKILLYNNSNNSIKEEDEDDYLTEGTMRSNEKAKNMENDDQNNSKENKSQEIVKNRTDKNDNSNNENDSEIKEKTSDKNIKENNNENHINIYNNMIKDNIGKEFDKNIEKNNNPINKISENQGKNNDNKEINNNKSMKNIDKIDNKNLEVSPQIKGRNTFSKMPFIINPISPKQIQINENFQKIKINSHQNNSNKNINILQDGSSNNLFSLNSENQNNINKNNFFLINSSDRNDNSTPISLIEKEISISQKIKNKIKNSVIKQNNFIDSPFTFSEISANKNGSNLKMLDVDGGSTLNNNYERNNFNYDYFGKKYISLKNNEDANIEHGNDDNLSKSMNQNDEDSFENGVPVLNNGNYYDANSEPIKDSLSLNKKKIVKNIEIKNKKTAENKKKYVNEINKAILLNKMRKNVITLPKKNIEKSKDNKNINKLYNLIKNSCYNLNKLSHNKYKKNNNKNNINVTKMNDIKTKEMNSLDINNEISRNIDTDPSGLGNKEFFHEDKKIAKKKTVNTNFNNYIENNKINSIRNKNVSSKKHKDTTPKNNFNNSLHKHYFFSNPNLSSNQENLNKTKIYNNKNKIKCYQINKLTPKSKSLGREKNKFKELNSKSKSKSNEVHKAKKKENLIKLKIKELLKEKTKRLSFPFKKNYYISDKSATPINHKDKKVKYWSLKSCQTPEIKKKLCSLNYIDSIFSEWILSTISNESRNGLSKRGNYFQKKKENKQASKSVSELIDVNLKKSNFRMLLSKSNFKKKNLNIVAKKIKYSKRNKTSKDKSNINNKNKNTLRSLKIINNSDSLRHKNIINKNNHNNINIIKNNDIHRIKKKSSDRSGIHDRKKIGKFLSNNLINSNSKMNNINTINDYNFNNNNYINKLIKNTIHSFIYDSTDNSKSGDKLRKIMQKQLTNPPKIKNNQSKENSLNKSKKISCDKIYEYKNNKNKIRKEMSINNCSDFNQKNPNENISNCKINNNNISINNMILNRKNKYCNINYKNKNGNNYYIKNSGLKKRKNIKTLNNSNNNENKKKLINFSNELENFYLNTEMCKNKYNSNLTYSNLMNNCKELRMLELSSNEKVMDEILINVLNKIFIFFNKDKSNTITLKDSFYKERIIFFENNIRKILDTMIEILCKTYKNKKIYNKINIHINKHRPSSTKNNNSNLIVIDKNNFINEMLYIYKHYLPADYKKMIMLHKSDINKVTKNNIFDKTFCPVIKSNNYKIGYISPKYRKNNYHNKNQSEIKNKNSQISQI